MKSHDQDSSNRISGDVIQRAEELLSQLIIESQSIGDLQSAEQDIGNKRNELLFKLNDQIDNTKEVLRQIEDMEKRLKKNLSQLESLRRVLGS